MALNRAAFLQSDVQTVPIEPLELPELGDSVFIKGMTGTARDEFEKSCRDQKGRLRGNIRARLVVLTAVDENGARIFSDDDIQMVGKFRVDVLQKMFNKAQELSGMSDADVEELGGDSDGPEAGTASSTN